MSATIDLKKLPHDHPLRNTPLGQINAAYTRDGGRQWKSVINYKIKDNTYNELDVGWTSAQWRCDDLFASKAPPGAEATGPQVTQGEPEPGA